MIESIVCDVFLWYAFCTSRNSTFLLTERCDRPAVSESDERFRTMEMFN